MHYMIYIQGKQHHFRKRPTWVSLAGTLVLVCISHGRRPSANVRTNISRAQLMYWVTSGMNHLPVIGAGASVAESLTAD